MILMHHLRDAVTYAGSIVTVAAGFVSLAFAQADAQLPAGAGGDANGSASVAALLVAISGLASAVGPQLYAALKLYLDERKEERRAKQEESRAKWERHDLANKLEASQYEVELLRMQVNDNRKLLDVLTRRDGDPADAASAARPDPAGPPREEPPRA